MERPEIFSENTLILDEQPREAQKLPESDLDQDNQKEVPDEARQALEIQLADFRVPYREQESYEQNEERAKALSFMEKKGLIRTTDQGLVVDTQKLRNEYESFRKQKLNNKQHLNRELIINTLQGLRGYSVEMSQDQKFAKDEVEARELFPIPNSANELGTDYPKRASQALLNVWEVGGNQRWTDLIPLPSGEKTTLTELAVIKALHDLDTRRTNRGLEIRNPQTHDYEPFTVDKFSEYTGLNPSVVGKDGKQYSMKASFSSFLMNHAPNLEHAGIITPEDVRLTSGTEAAKLYGQHKPSFRGPLVSFKSGATSARYTFGRSTFPGTNQKIDRETMSPDYLDASHVGIFQTLQGKKKLLYILDLLPEEETDRRKKEVELQASQKGKTLKKDEITALTIIKQEEVARLLHEYNIRDFISRRADESQDQYDLRASKMDDPEFVTTTFKDFLREAGIGSHNLAWEEQLVLANAVLNIEDKDRLKNFVKNYSYAGLRSFLSMDLDKNMGEAVLDIGERLDHPAAVMIFKKYSKLVDAARRVTQYIEGNFRGDQNFSDKAVRQIQENLLRRAKDLLVNFKDRLANLPEGEKLDAFVVLNELFPIDEELLLYTNTIKALVNQQKEIGKQVSFNEIKDTQLEIIPASELAEIQEMEEIYRENYPTPPYPAEFRETLVKALVPEDETSSRFYVARHQNRVTAFARFTSNFDKKGKLRSIHFGAFNMNQKYKGGLIGEAVMQQFLKQESSHRVPILAECDPQTTIAKKYIQYGFKGYDAQNMLGVYALKIRLDPEGFRESAHQVQEKDQERIIDLIKQNKTTDGQRLIEVHDEGSSFKFDRLKKGYELVNYFSKAGKVYCVFEVAGKAGRSVTA